ncbi:MAG: tRNA (guanosine(37)-N1)-methyltransferase TrmD [Bacilli bacterium]|jgi:tRNA (guanine37-N1)-methyltransferase|nr:tRNA (guanosine(37)-N1)-methyltransferase TrmD [Bacilli bacterium]MDY0063679.1 tRNA (guanosine(37)-N1)-methyltransferase TrmD [Bacilli bacterium]
MRIDILTLFPEMFAGMLSQSILKRAIERDLVEVHVHDFRSFATNKHKKVDDTIYGGGAGMLISVEPIVRCLQAIPGYERATKILTTPAGMTYTQEKACSFAKQDHLIIVCGHYEGIDERILHFIDEEISLGDFILTGGEIASLAIADSVIRLLPEVINEISIASESYVDGLLEYPQYTKPPVFEGLEVPEVLLSGNHEAIRSYRRYMAIKKTYLRRKDLLEKMELSKEDNQFLEKIKQEND